jgi:hypothetical protein
MGRDPGQEVTGMLQAQVALIPGIEPGWLEESMLV